MPTVLVVDDDADIRLVMSLVVTGLGHEVVTAGDGIEALHVLEGRDVDLLLVDRQMPRLDGLELVRELRRREGEVRTPVLVVSAHGSQADVDAAHGAGADDFLAKPFAIAELGSRVASMVGDPPAGEGR